MPLEALSVGPAEGHPGLPAHSFVAQLEALVNHVVASAQPQQRLSEALRAAVFHVYAVSGALRGPWPPQADDGDARLRFCSAAFSSSGASISERSRPRRR